HRIAATVADLAACCGGDRRVLLAREMTKLHEQSILCTAGELLHWLHADAYHRRGEFVLVVAGADRGAGDGAAEIALDALLSELLALAGTRDAVKAAVRLTGLPRNQVYARAMALR